MTSLAPEPGTPRYERAVKVLFSSGGRFDHLTRVELIALIDSDADLDDEPDFTYDERMALLKAIEEEESNRPGIAWSPTYFTALASAKVKLNAAIEVAETP